MAGEADRLTLGELTIERAEGDGALSLVFQGRSNDRSPTDTIVPYCERMLDEAAARGVGLEMHLETVDQMSSMTLGALIEVIARARARTVKLVLVFDTSRRWQKLTSDALRVFARNDGLVEVRATAARG